MDAPIITIVRPTRLPGLSHPVPLLPLNHRDTLVVVPVAYILVQHLIPVQLLVLAVMLLDMVHMVPAQVVVRRHLLQGL